MRTGDLLGSGTISGPEPGQQGSLLEMSEGGKKDVQISGEVSRTFLDDGDTVTIRGFCAGKEGEKIGIGFGPCTATIRPATIRPALVRQ
jgi:fumarylacetoacetase